jgi:hypothetical protein
VKSIDILNFDSQRLLRSVFKDKIGEVWVCWTSNMAGKRVKNLVEGDLPDDEDCYFCTGLMKPGSLKRSKENVSRIYMLVMDEKGEPIEPWEPARLPQGVNTKAGGFKVRVAHENLDAKLSAEDVERLAAMGRKH